MRRSDKEITDIKVFQELAEKVLVGYLAVMQDDEYPRSIPLNFVLYEECIYFHGARAGEKYDLLSGEPKASFCIPQVLSYIPSSFLGNNACDASHFYRSAMVYGTGGVVSDSEEKHKALVALMEKYQPGVEANMMNTENEEIHRNIGKTAVYKVTTDRIVMKENLGGYMDEGQRSSVKKALEENGSDVDRLTASLIKSKN